MQIVWRIENNKQQLTQEIALATLLMSRLNFLKQKVTEAALQRCSWEKVCWKYSANLQEDTYAEVRFDIGVHIFRTPFHKNTSEWLLRKSLKSKYIIRVVLRIPDFWLFEKHEYTFHIFQSAVLVSKFKSVVYINFFTVDWQDQLLFHELASYWYLTFNVTSFLR